MFVNAHSTNRINDRLGMWMGPRVLERLEGIMGQPGTIAYIVGDLPYKAQAKDGSNGELVIAVAVEGSVETVYFRRATQDISPEFFGAQWVFDLRERRNNG
jgi:hypothetical protein